MTTLKQRQKDIGGKITNHGNGYRSLISVHGGFSGSMLAYIELPKGHPDIDKDYYELTPKVNGGLTFGSGRVYGWDYAHFENDYDVHTHVDNALSYFRRRER